MLISLDTEMALIKLLSCVSPIEKSIGLKRPGISVDKLLILVLDSQFWDLYFEPELSQQRSK